MMLVNIDPPRITPGFQTATIPFNHFFRAILSIGSSMPTVSIPRSLTQSAVLNLALLMLGISSSAANLVACQDTQVMSGS
jgi:hypothetical protein